MPDPVIRSIPLDRLELSPARRQRLRPRRCMMRTFRETVRLDEHAYRGRHETGLANGARRIGGEHRDRIGQVVVFAHVGAEGP